MANTLYSQVINRKTRLILDKVREKRVLSYVKLIEEAVVNHFDKDGLIFGKLVEEWDGKTYK